ncbi:hypothetical protein LCGC14_2475360 [marine sediment metagenome]|uniref:Uncharacterized protein n=1 Tax=marine sediment metagenome TaxID=412755 RepID=A0A0F9BX16_9ZZZZ
MKRITFKLHGDSTLLMHNPAGMRVPSTGKGLETKKIPLPEEEAKASLYQNLVDETLYVPAVAVRNAMLSGAKGARIGKVGAATILAGAILLVEERFKLVRDGEPLKTYDVIDTRRVVVQRQGIVRSRGAIILPWTVECVYDFNDALMGLNYTPVQQALENAGQLVGLLDYRPEKKGWFGRFQCSDFVLEGEVPDLNEGQA